MSAHELPPLHLIVLAGGASSRARGSDSAPPKQFREIGGRMLLLHSVQELCVLPEVVSLTVAAPVAWHPVVRSALEKAGLPRPWLVAPAGATRTASTWLATLTLALDLTPADGDLVAVHDAARPFATRHLLARLAAAAATHGAAVPGVPLADTVVQMEEAGSDHVAAIYLERDVLRALQTPQVFRWNPFYEAHRWCHEEDLGFTDDGGLLAARGLSPVVVMGEAENWKVTTEADLQRAESQLREI
jgi:2-C-methyl-D-erythritol 4-phosphate cytidylyltransferase/2-C-methyl-D-erythritol 2,4-cyclodiphosphate synthase